MYNIVQRNVLEGFEMKTPDELYLFGRLTSTELFLGGVFWLLVHCRVIAAYRVITWRYRSDSKVTPSRGVQICRQTPK